MSIKESKEVPFQKIAGYLKGQDETLLVRFDAQRFEQTIELMDKHFETRLRQADAKEKDRITTQQHRATIGYPQEVQEMKTLIRQLIEEYNLHQVPFPPMFENLADALFHETWGLGAVSVWYEQHRNIGKCRVNDRDVWYKLPGEEHRIHEQYRDARGVQRMIQNLLRNDDKNFVKKGREYAQLSLFDGTRVTISLPGVARHTTVAFRRRTVHRYTLDEQKKLGTIEDRAIPIYRMIARCGTKGVLTGEPGTGKTTFLKTLFGETKPQKVTICCEFRFELDLKRDFPDRDITEYEGDETNLASVVIPLTLRQDASQYLMGEVREVEAAGYKEALTNTTGFVWTSMHESDSANVPGTLARKELRQSEGMNYRICLADFAGKIDFAMVMSFGGNEEIINSEVSTIELDPYTLAVTSRRIIWYDGVDWRYAAEMDERLARRMRRYDREAYEQGMAALRELATEKPIPESERAVTLLHASVGV